MICRIRLKRGRRIQRKQGKNRHLALAFGALLVPAALMAYVLGLWRLAADMGMAGAFGITGLFSHWQIWMVAGVLLQAASAAFNRYGRSGGFQLPRLLSFRILPVKMASDPGNPATQRRAGA
jgi:hypothetical protein